MGLFGPKISLQIWYGNMHTYDFSNVSNDFFTDNWGLFFDFQEQDYKVEARKLHLTSLPTSPFDLEIVTEIEPQNNTSLEGLYKSTGNFCTQCEAEGFRKITYFQAWCPLKFDCQLWIFSAGIC